MNSYLDKEIIQSTTESYGGKADGLIFLLRKGFNVPPFFIIPDSCIRKIISQKWSSEKTIEEWMDKERPERNSLWAVRSSAEIEDGKEKSFAGIFTSELNCNLKNLPDALDKVIAGFSQAISSGYHSDDSFRYNILLQEMICSETSGVGFSINPLDAEKENPVVNIIPGLGFKLVSGEETAMIIELDEKGFKVVSDESEFQGQIYSNGYKEIKKTKDELFVEAETFLPELRKALLQLEKWKGYPVDTEFTIRSNKLFWLQIRPITNLPTKEEYTVWDNSNVSANYPGVVMPLTSSFVLHSYSNAYIAMFRFLGGGENFIRKNMELFKNMSGTIHGAMYYNVTAWQRLLFQMPFGKKTSGMITKMWGAEKAKFKLPEVKSSPFLYMRLFFNLTRSMVFFSYYKKKYIDQFEKIKKNFNPDLMQTKKHGDLVDVYLDLESKIGKYWYPPMINGFYAMVSYNFMKKNIESSVIHETYPNFLNDSLMGSGDVISVKIVRQLQNLLEAFHKSESAKNRILQENPSIALQSLKDEFPELYLQTKKYIDSYGERCDEGELKLETVNYKEDPLKFIAFLQTNLAAGFHETSGKKKFDYKKILRENYRNRPFRLLFTWVMLRFTIDRVRDRENFRFIRTKTFAIVRSVFRAMDKTLLETGKINQKGDSLYLRFDELMNVNQVDQYREIIEKRKKEYERYFSMEHPVRYHLIKDEFVPIEIKKGMNDELEGTGCSSGIFEGEVILLDPKNIHQTDVTGKIVIASFFEPGWIGLFSRAGGLVSERGSLLSHTSILCREMGVPAIVAAKNITQLLKNGERIRMNGATGKIEKLITNG